jgi:hypothetical protein
MKEVSRNLVTNDWDKSVELWRDEVQQGGVFSALRLKDVMIYTVQTNGHYEFGYFIGPNHDCREVHVKDYPKTSTASQGVQWYINYESVASLNGIAITNSFHRYTFPHKKITTTTEIKLKLETNVVTKIEIPVEPEKCVTCGKEK